MSVKTTMRVPEFCFCGAEWKGGHQVPGKFMTEGLRVFYLCGASLSVREVLRFEDGEVYGYQILFKNCSKLTPEVPNA